MSDAKSIEVKDGSFEWAKLQLQKGKAVRRQSWPWRHYLKLSKLDNAVYDCYFDVHKYNFPTQDLMANDWVLCTAKEMQND
jgi:hypothetical protein